MKLWIDIENARTVMALAGARMETDARLNLALGSVAALFWSNVGPPRVILQLITYIHGHRRYGKISFVFNSTTESNICVRSAGREGAPRGAPGSGTGDS